MVRFVPSLAALLLGGAGVKDVAKEVVFQACLQFFIGACRLAFPGSKH